MACRVRDERSVACCDVEQRALRTAQSIEEREFDLDHVAPASRIEIGSLARS